MAWHQVDEKRKTIWSLLIILDGWVAIIRTGKRSYRVGNFFINSAVGSLIVGIYVEEIYEEEDWCFWKAFQNSF